MNRSFAALGLGLIVLCSLLFCSCGGVGGSSVQAGSPPPPPPPPPATLNSINHIIFMYQENRSFDSYFGKLNDYLKANGYPQAGLVDGIPASGFNNSGIGTYQSRSVCMENMSPDWAEDRHQVNLNNPAGIVPGKAATMPMDGFVNTAAGIAVSYQFTDTVGRRAMGYYTDHELNYYYFMAANFATSDRFYSPAPTNTPINRIYGFGATSQGIIHTPNGSEACPNERQQVSAKPIWQVLSENNISWKIYITDPLPTCGNFSPSCMIRSTYLQFFSWVNAVPGSTGFNPEPMKHMAPLQCPAGGCAAGVTDYFTDVAKGNLPSVAFIETGSFTGRDEHPSGLDPSENPPYQSKIDIQVGAKFVSGIINALMGTPANPSPSWKDSVFIWAFDEGGGAFDHVPPMTVPNPDGIAPILCLDKDVHVGGDFNITGFRIPNLVISPFTKKNFVSHTPMDYTAILKLIETRWGLPALTKRDAGMPDMTEFFDFSGPDGPWSTPPTPPPQAHNTPCDFSLQ